VDDRILKKKRWRSQIKWNEITVEGGEHWRRMSESKRHEAMMKIRCPRTLSVMSFAETLHQQRENILTPDVCNTFRFQFHENWYEMTQKCSVEVMIWISVSDQRKSRSWFVNWNECDNGLIGCWNKRILLIHQRNFQNGPGSWIFEWRQLTV
jgi:hypothetical protein